MDSKPVKAPGRDLALYLCGPGLVIVAVAMAFAVAPWRVPFAPQAQQFGAFPAATSLLVGAFGVWLSSRVGLPSAPALSDGRRWFRLILLCAGFGVLVVVVNALLDSALDLERIDARAIGQPTINVAFPASIAHYLYGSVAQESLFRIGPTPILAWVLGKLAFRNAASPLSFWIVAVALSLVEPVVQSAMIFAAHPAVALIAGGEEAVGNIVVVALYWRFGWAAPLVVRIVLELGWHVLWPALGR